MTKHIYVTFFQYPPNSHLIVYNNSLQHLGAYKSKYFQFYTTKMDVPKEQRQQQLSFPATFSDLPAFFLSRWHSLSEYGKATIALRLIVLCAASTYLFNDDKKLVVFTTASTLLISLYQMLWRLENHVLAAEKKNNCK